MSDKMECRITEGWIIGTLLKISDYIIVNARCRYQRSDAAANKGKEKGMK
jgi:hypothetical protein